MNNTGEFRFQQKPVKLNRNEDGTIGQVCLNDICTALNRIAHFRDGTAVRKCPSARITDESCPKDLYADFGETVQFIKWLCSGSKMLGLLGRELLEALQELHIGPAAKAESVPDPQPQKESAEPVELEYSGHKFTMKMCDGRYMVNATEMSRPFDKRPTVWLKIAETLKLRQRLVDDGVHKDQSCQIITSRGPHGSTWLEIHLWVHFAQWLSPAFACWCGKKLVPLMQNGYVTLCEQAPAKETSRPQTPDYEQFERPDKTPIPLPVDYNEAVALIEDQSKTISKQWDFIKLNKHKVEHYEETIETREWFSTTMIANELGTSAIKLNIFLMDEGIQVKKEGEWAVSKEYKHLRDYHFYEWFNFKTKYTNKFKINSWTPEGREYIIELWKKENG